MVLEDNNVSQYVDGESKQPDNEPHKSIWIRGNRKAMQIITDRVKNEIVPMLIKNNTAFKMMEALLNAYEVNNATRTLALKRQLNHIEIKKGESMHSYFLRVASLRDELASIGTIIKDKELTLMAIDGLPNSWEMFAQGISARDKLPDFNRLKGDFLQEESRKLKKGGKSKVENEELHVLNTNTYKGKKKHFKKKKGNHKNDKPKKDLSKIKCFKCDKFGHYKLNCPDNSKQLVNYTSVSNEEEIYDPKK